MPDGQYITVTAPPEILEKLQGLFSRFNMAVSRNDSGAPDNAGNQVARFTANDDTSTILLSAVVAHNHELSAMPQGLELS